LKKKLESHKVIIDRAPI